MNRTELLRQLRAHSPSDERERRMLERITDFVKDNETCFDRNLKMGHLTGSAWIVDQNRSHALLTHHAKLDIWVQPGGHVEIDPDMLNAEHAFDEMAFDDLLQADLEHCILIGEIVQRQWDEDFQEWKYVIEGESTDGAYMAVAAKLAFKDNVVVITAFLL